MIIYRTRSDYTQSGNNEDNHSEPHPDIRREHFSTISHFRCLVTATRSGQMLSAAHLCILLFAQQIKTFTGDNDNQVRDIKLHLTTFIVYFDAGRARWY